SFSLAPSTTRPSAPAWSATSASFPASPVQPVAAAPTRSRAGAVSRHAASPAFDSTVNGTAPASPSIRLNAILYSSPTLVGSANAGALSAAIQITRARSTVVIPGRRAAVSPESIFHRPVFMDSGPRPPADPGMTHRWSRQPPGPLHRHPAAIDDDRRAADKGAGGRRKQQGRTGDIDRLSQTAQRRLR